SDALKKVIEPLWAVHDYMGVENMKKRDPALVAELKKANPPIAQPLVREHSVDPLYTYRHKWSPNDIIMWDNRQTMHLALADFAPGAHRYCMRTTILGTPSGYIYAPK